MATTRVKRARGVRTSALIESALSGAVELAEKSLSASTFSTSTTPTTKPRAKRERKPQTSLSPSTPPSAKAVEVGQWLQEQARQENLVGVEMRSNSFHFGVGDDSRSLMYDDPMCGTVIAQAIQGTWPLKVVVYDTERFVCKVAELSGTDLNTIVGGVVGDMAAIGSVTGTEQPTSAKEMVEQLKAVSGMNLNAYYTKIAVPMSRIRASQLPPGKPWKVVYHHLMAQVITRFSNEPILLRGAESGDPLEEFRPLVEEEFGSAVEEGDAAANVLQWAALGYIDDRDYKHLLPTTDMKALNKFADIQLPLLRMQVSQTYQAAMKRGNVQTRYGRKMLIDGSTTAAQVMEFVLQGTVNDIVEVAAVTFSNQGVSVAPPFTTEEGSKITIRGTVAPSKRREWLKTVKQLAYLAAPLAPVSLNPVVIDED